MKNSKKGISLIVLIITIIVIVILATAILVSVLTNNPISEANKARYESDRDNMQAVFTNTVGKIMAENQGVVNVTAGQINTETAGVNEATGEVAYTVDNATVAANASGKIVFDKGTNDATTYYTGKKLPIYAAGETKWYVDSEGVLSLEVAGVKYGSGVVEGGAGSEEEEALAPGLYQTDGKFISWEELLEKDKNLECDCGRCTFSSYLTINDNELKTPTSFYMCFIPFINGKIVIDNSVTKIRTDAFSYCNNLTEVILPNSITSINTPFTYCEKLTSVTIPSSVQSIGSIAFLGCENLTDIHYKGTTEQWNQIEKISGETPWNGGRLEITVHCTNGDIIIPATP